MSKSTNSRNVQLLKYNPLDNVDDRPEAGQRAILIVVTLCDDGAVCRFTMESGGLVSGGLS